MADLLKIEERRYGNLSGALETLEKEVLIEPLKGFKRGLFPRGRPSFQPNCWKLFSYKSGFTRSEP